jgi:hypothetical protein
MTGTKSSNMAEDDAVQSNIGRRRHISDDITSLDSWSEASIRLSEVDERFAMLDSVPEQGNANGANRYSGGNDPLSLNPMKLAANLPGNPPPEQLKLLSSASTITNDSSQIDTQPNLQRKQSRKTSESKTTDKHLYDDTQLGEVRHRSKTSPHGFGEGLHGDFGPGARQAKSASSPLRSHRSPIMSINVNMRTGENKNGDLDTNEQSEKMKTKLKSVWHNVKYGEWMSCLT